MKIINSEHSQKVVEPSLTTSFVAHVCHASDGKHNLEIKIVYEEVNDSTDITVITVRGRSIFMPDTVPSYSLEKGFITPLVEGWLLGIAKIIRKATVSASSARRSAPVAIQFTDDNRIKFVIQDMPIDEVEAVVKMKLQKYLDDMDATIKKGRCGN